MQKSTTWFAELQTSCLTSFSMQKTTRCHFWHLGDFYSLSEQDSVKMLSHDLFDLMIRSLFKKLTRSRDSETLQPKNAFLKFRCENALIPRFLKENTAWDWFSVWASRHWDHLTTYSSPRKNQNLFLLNSMKISPLKLWPLSTRAPWLSIVTNDYRTLSLTKYLMQFPGTTWPGRIKTVSPATRRAHGNVTRRPSL